MANTQRHSGIALLTLGAILSFPISAQFQTSPQRAVTEAHQYLNTAQNGRYILGFVHFGAQYRGHEYVKTLAVKNGNEDTVAGHFALVYRFHWEEDGITDVAFLCDARGRVYKVQAMSTNAFLSPPFGLAQISISLLGNIVMDAYKDKMSASDRRFFRKLVDDADAKAMLEWSLAFDQALSR